MYSWSNFASCILSNEYLKYVAPTESHIFQPPRFSPWNICEIQRVRARWELPRVRSIETSVWEMKLHYDEMAWCPSMFRAHAAAAWPHRLSLVCLPIFEYFTRFTDLCNKSSFSRSSLIVIPGHTVSLCAASINVRARRRDLFRCSSFNRCVLRNEWVSKFLKI